MKQFPKSRVERKWLPLEEYKRLRTSQAEADMERIMFLEKLDDSDLLLTDWEQEFVGNFMQARSEGREQDWFTEGRRIAADKMRDKYGHEIGEKNGSRVRSPHHQEIPEAEPACCMYLVRGDDHRQRPCNEPATCQTRSGFRYCETHRQIAAMACKHKKTSLITNAISNR